MNVNYSDTFLKSASRLSRKLIAQAETREALFKSNSFHPLLRTHKLHGKDQAVWSFSVNSKYRIKFVFINPTSVLFLDIGTHDIYQ